MPKSTTQEWQRGLTLWQAIEKYAPNALWNEYVQLGADLTQTYSEEFDVQAPIDYRPKKLAEDPIKTFARKSGRQQKIDRILKFCFLKQLREENYLVLAYRSPRFKDAKPEWILAKNWSSGKVAWNTSELLAGDIIFSDLRILPARQPVPRKLAKRYPTSGRPSLDDTIKLAWEALVAEAQIPMTGPISAIFPRIRNKVHELDADIRPDATGLGDKKLYTFLSKRVSDHRAGKK